MADATRCPEDVLGWIPCYPDEGLSDAQRGAVEAHAASCRRCREEIALVRGEVEPAVDAAETEAVLARVLERTRAADPPARSGAPAAPRRRGRTRLTRIALAAGLALACAGAGALGALAVRGGGEPLYTTAAEPAPAAADERPLLDVVFHADADAGRIHAALRAVNGQIVAGPSELGRYQVRLGAGADARAAARALAAEDAGVAVYAEPAGQ
jgi:hypothetical protein